MELSPGGKGQEYQTPPGILIGNPETLLLSYDRDWGQNGEVRIVEQLDDSELKQAHSLRIRELFTTLGLSEKDVPCLHFTFINSNETHVVSLNDIRESLYFFLKKIMGEWNSMFIDAEKKQIEKWQLERQKNSRKSEVGQHQAKIQDAENRLRNYFTNQKSETEINFILEKIVEINKDESSRRETLSLIRELKKKYPQKDSQWIFTDLNRLIDLVPKVNGSNYSETSVPEPEHNLNKRLIETIIQFSRISNNSKQNMEAWDVFIAHAGADVEWAEILYNYLSPSLKTFLDSRCMLPGDHWDEVLPNAQKNSRITVLLVSDATKEAYYAREEIVAAIQQARGADGDHRVIPIMLPGATNLYGLNRIHHITLRSKAELQSAAMNIIDTYNKVYPG